jgi:hypothetical protein
VPRIPWENADKEWRKLRTIGEFFASPISLFNILNICSTLFPSSTGAAPQLQDDVQYPEQLFYAWAITIS